MGTSSSCSEEDNQTQALFVLKNVHERLKEEASLQMAEDFCETHRERLKLFCVDHQKPICVICRDSKDHKKHQCVPINEAAADSKKELRSTLMQLKTKFRKCKEEKLTSEKMSAHIQKQAKQTEEIIKGEFQKLYQFLRAEEAARIDGLRTEALKKSQAMQIRRINLIAETSSLSKTVKAAETDLEAADLSFMLNYEAIKERAQCTLPDPETPSGALIDEANHRGNLLFQVWKKMKSIIQYNKQGEGTDCSVGPGVSSVDPGVSSVGPGVSSVGPAVSSALRI